MRMFLFGLLVLVVCTPLVLVSLLFAAAHWPAMDRFTMALPMDVRTTIAEMAMSNAGYGKDADKKLERVVRLDPRNSTARGRICVDAEDKGTASAAEACRLAVELAPTEWNLNALGLTEERAGDPCTAEDTFTKANSKANGGNSNFLRNMGRAALECGRVAYSVAELEAAKAIDAKWVDDPDEGDDFKANLKSDQEWLTVAYEANKQPKLAAEACVKAHPEWKSCGCALRDGKAVCRETPLGAAR